MYIIDQSYFTEVHWDKYTTAWICVKLTTVQFRINIYNIAKCLPVSIIVTCLFSISEKNYIGVYRARRISLLVCFNFKQLQVGMYLQLGIAKNAAHIKKIIAVVYKCCGVYG